MTFPTLILIIMLALTLGVLLLGIIVMARGGKLNKKYSTKLMGLRVFMQVLAIGIIALLFLFWQSS